MTQITIFGGTGMTGVCVVSEAIALGYRTKLLVRNQELLGDLLGKVDVVKGNVVNYGDVKKALEGSSFVVVVLGTRNELDFTTEMSDGLKNIVQGMKDLNIGTISTCLSAFLFDESSKVPKIFSNIHREHELMLEILEHSGLDWIGVCPPHIADGSKSEVVATPNKRPPLQEITKQNLGRFLLEVVSHPELHKCKLGVSNKPA